MNTTFEPNEEVGIKDHPGYTGTVVLVDVYARRYLLDCHPGALGHYTWYKIRGGYGNMLAGNWFDEDQLYKIEQPVYDNPFADLLLSEIDESE